MTTFKKLLKSSAAVLAFTAAPAFAQADQPSDGQQGASAAALDQTAEEIVITGYRASLQRAQDIKRQAPSVVDAITNEDLGKFTDQNIADSLQRVPGLNVERTAGTYDSGYGITIRGLGPVYGSTTMNGREILGVTGLFGDGGRNFDFSALPPEVLSGVTVYKTSTSERVEPGLAGQVDLLTLRPLDQKPKGAVFGTIAASVNYETQSKKVRPRVSGILGFKNDARTLGVYVAALHSRDLSKRNFLDTYKNNVTFKTSDGVQHNGIQLPRSFDTFQASETRFKDSVSSGLQFRPDDQLEVNLDYSFNSAGIRRNDQANYFVSSVRRADYNQVIPADAFTFGGYDGGINSWDARKIPVGSATNFYASSDLSALRLRYKNITHVAGANVSWWDSNHRFNITGDLSYNQVDYKLSWLKGYIASGSSSRIRDVADERGNIPIVTTFNNGGPNFSDPALYTDVYGEHFEARTRGKRWAGRIDLRYIASDSLTFKAGARWVDTRQSYVLMTATGAQSPISTANALTSNLVRQPYFDFSVPEVSLSGYCSSNPQFCSPTNFGKGSLAGSFPTTTAGKAGDVLQFDPGSSYAIHERNLGTYAQLDWKTQVGSWGVNGNAGVRAVRISEFARAFQGSCTKAVSTATPCLEGTQKTVLVADNSRYWEYLPSVNISLEPSSTFKVRLAAAKTISLAGYNALAPSGNATVVVAGPNGNLLSNNVASTGNTRLRPTQAKNYDVTIEKYTPNGGSFVVSLFYKDVKDLLTGLLVSQTTIPGQGALLFDASTTVNQGKGHTHGFEAGLNQPLTFLPGPFDGFGVQANYTYTSVSNLQFIGASKHNVNGTLYFEKAGWSARVAASYRSSYLWEFNDGRNYARGQTRVDASLSKTLPYGFQVILTGSNLTGQDTSVYYGRSGAVAHFISQPTTYTAGLRWSF